MENNNDLISVIEDLLEADMTAPKKVKNPQNKMSEEEQVDEAQDKTDKAIAANKLSDTAKPKADNAADNSSEVVGSNKGAAIDAGGDKDVGQMDKGKLPSDAADNSAEVIGSEKGAAIDAGGDKDVGKMGSKEKGNPSDASPVAEPNKGPHNQAMDEDLHDGDDSSDGVVSEDDETVEEGQDTKIVKNANDEQLPDDEKESMKNMKEDEDLEWDWEKIDSLSEEDFNELVSTLDEEELVEFNNRFESLVEAEEASEEDIVNEADGEMPSKAHVMKMCNDGMSKAEMMKMHPDADKDKLSAMIDDCKEKMDEAADKYDEELSEEDAAHICESKYHVCAVVVEHDEWGVGKPLIGRHAEPDADGNVEWYDIEFEHGIEEKVMVEGLNILDEMNHGKPKKKMGEEDDDNDSDDDDEEEDDDDKEMDEAMDPVGKADADIDNDGDTDKSDEYLHKRRKAIKAAMSKEDTEVEEATGEKLEKAPTASTNEPMRPDQEKGDNEPETKGGSPDKGPHDQSKDPIDTATKANPKGAVKEEEEVSVEDQLTEDLDEDFKEKAAVIFETAVNEKASIIREEVEAQYAAVLEEEVETLNNKVNEYVDYAVNEWLEENALEIKYSLRTEIAENFIREMKTVFETNFIDIPEEEVSVVDELTEAVESYKEQLEEQATSLEELNKQLLEIKRKEIVDGIGEDLPQTQKIRLEKLSENVEAEDIEEFRYKIEQLKEGYFDESSEQPLLSSLSEEVFGGTVIEEENDSSISQYAKFLSKTVTK